MTLDPLNVAIVALLLAVVALLEWADRRDLVVTGLHRLRIRCGRQVPVGRHRVEDGVSVRVGRPDTTLVFKLPLLSPGEQRSARYVGVTEQSTCFSVGDEVVTLDTFLEAYDDRLGPLEVQVYEAGKLAATERTGSVTREYSYGQCFGQWRPYS